MANKFGEEGERYQKKLDKFGEATPGSDAHGASEHFLRKLLLNGRSGSMGITPQSILSSKHMDTSMREPQDKFEAAGKPEVSLRYSGMGFGRGADYDGDVLDMTSRCMTSDKFGDGVSDGMPFEIKGVMFRDSRATPDKFGGQSHDDLVDEYLRSNGMKKPDKFS